MKKHLIEYKNLMNVKLSLEKEIDVYRSLLEGNPKIHFALHRCWWGMLEMNCVGDNNKMLVTVLAILITNIHYRFTSASGTNIQKISPT